MSSRRRTSARQYERQIDLPTRSRPPITPLTASSSAPPPQLPNQFFMPTPFINSPRNLYEAVFDGYTSTGYAPPPVTAPGYMGPMGFFGRPLPFIPPHGPQAYQPMPPFQFNTSNRIFEISDDDQSNTPRRPMPIIDNPSPGTLTAEEQRKTSETREWLDKASSEVKRDQKEFQSFSQHIVAKALTHTPHENFFYNSIDNEFSQSQLLRCIYYLSSKIHDKDKKSSNGYEFALKRVRESTRRHTSSRRNDPPQSSESASGQGHFDQNRNTHSVRFHDDEEQSEQDTRDRSSTASHRHTETHRSTRIRPTRSIARATDRATTTNNSTRNAAASAAANAAINRRAALTPPPKSTTEELAALSRQLSEAEAEIACNNVERVELHELKQKAEARKCKICYTADIDCIFVDCYHMATCLECAQGCEKCPVCRKEGVSVAKVYL